VWGAPFGQWVAGHSVAPYGRGVGEAGPFWPCSGAVPKGVAQRWPVGEGPPPLLAREAPGGVWPVGKGSPPQWGAYRAVRWPVRGVAKVGQWGLSPMARVRPRSRCGVAGGQWGREG